MRWLTLLFEFILRRANKLRRSREECRLRKAVEHLNAEGDRHRHEADKVEAEYRHEVELLQSKVSALEDEVQFLVTITERQRREVEAELAVSLRQIATGHRTEGKT